MKKSKALSRKNVSKAFVLFLVCISHLSLAQVRFSSEPDKFIAEVGTMLQASKSEAMISASNNFKTAWTLINPAHQKKIIVLSQDMQKTKKYRANPHFADLFSIISAAQTNGIPATQLDSLILMLNKSVNKLSSTQFAGLMQTLRLFLEKDYLFKTNFNSLSVSGGSYSFKYMDAPVEAPLPGDGFESTGDTARVETSLDSRKVDFFSDIDNSKEVVDDWSTIPPADSTGNVLDVGYTPPLQPTLEGPMITFKNINFNIRSPYDSTVFKGTSGSLLLKNNTFVGKGGKFDWSGAGLAPEDLYCELKEYNFNIRSTKIIAEGATLHYPSRTDKQVDGIFEFDSKRHSSQEDNQYPRFKSFTNNVELKGLGESIKYKGGLSLGGRRIYSSCIDEGYGTIEVMHEGATSIRSTSNRFELGDSTISADICNVNLYMGNNDSIYHPGTIFKFNKNKGILKLYKQSGFKHAPFIDTYHKIEIEADALTWDLNNPKIDFSIINAKDQIPAIFESEEYFSANKYAAINGLYRFHPLQLIYNYSEKTQEKEFYADDVAKNMKIEPVTLRGSMVSLMKGGFIDYNTKTGFIKLRSKAIHYVLSRRNKKDYDNINFISIEPSGHNATLDLKTNELTVRGVDKVYISDSLNVYFVPDSNEVKILKNRDFKFNGQIFTDNFLFKGKSFQFSYDSFLVHLPNIEVIKISAKEADNKDKKKALTNELTYSSGILYINKPHNKAGRKKYVQFPMFESNTGASVVFNKPGIAQGAYDTTMKFKIPPFQLDSLGSSDHKTIGFEGEFDSGGIFPSFKERLVVMPDHSLGFEHKVPVDGFKLYDGKGKFYNKLILNNQGLRGDGEVHYLNAVLYSKDFLFLKDSVLTIGTKLINKEGPHAGLAADVKFPDMYVEEYKLKWLPRSDKMYISDTKGPIQFYKNTATLQGTANLTSRGMFGEGILLTRGSESESENFHFEQTRFTGQDANFQIKSDNPAKAALLCKMVKLEFDLDKSIAKFSPEVAGSASNEFPYAMYKSSLDNGVWDLKKKTIIMKMPAGGDINKSYFYSTRLDQDSLVFNATEAVYDITKLTLNIKGIPYINVADGKVFPEGNKVFIQENAVMQTLENAKIIIDTSNEFHHLYDGKIDIKSRLKFEGVATYQYVNLGSDTLAIKFTEFKLTEEEKKIKDIYTIATGLVKEEDNLRIGPRIFFKGKVTMFAPKKFLSFDGLVKLDLKGELKNSQWLKYYNPGDSSEVVINMENATADDGSPLSTGLHLNGNQELYTSFTSQKKDPADVDVIKTSGLLNYNGERNEFIVGSKLKLQDPTKKGNMITYNDLKSTMKYEGTFNFFKPDKSMEILSAGTGEGNLKNSNYSFNTLLNFNFKMHPSVFSAFGRSVKQILQYLPDTSTSEVADQRQQSLPYKITEIAGPAAGDKFRNNSLLSKGSLALISSDLAKGMVLSDVNLKWSAQHKSYYSEGPIFISNIQKEDISKPSMGYIEIKKGAEFDIINIYLEPMENAWYFLTYEENRLGFLSANDDLNRIIDEKSDGDKIDRSKFFFTKAEDGERAKFLNDFKQKYLGIAHLENQSEQVVEEEPVADKPKVKQSKKDKVEEEAPGTTYEVDESLMTPADKKKAKKYKKKADFDMDKYDETVEETPKPKTTVDQQKQSQKDQKKLKELLGN